MKRTVLKWMLAGAAACVAATPALAQMQPWEKALYDAARKEKPVTVYTAHYNTDEAAALCAALD